MTALMAGMRQGELLALKRGDLSVDTADVYVQRTLEHEGGTRFTFADPKTPKSRRHIKLTPLAAAALRRHLAHQAEQRLALGPDWGQGKEEYRDLVFTDERGCPLDGRRYVSRDLTKVLKEAQLPTIRFHDLRHTCATMLLVRSVHPKVVSEFLGHASIGITLDLYSHCIPDMQDTAVNAMTTALGT